MQSEFSSPLTRFDAVLWFLRVQLWFCLVGLVLSVVQPYSLLSWGTLLQNCVSGGLPVLALLLFPTALANSALGESARDPVTSLDDLRSLVLRCVGLALFVGVLGWAFIGSGYILYSLVPRVSSAWVFGSGIMLTYMRAQIAGTAVRFILGFFLAFGPAIRDNFRAH